MNILAFFLAGAALGALAGYGLGLWSSPSYWGPYYAPHPYYAPFYQPRYYPYYYPAYAYPRFYGWYPGYGYW